MAFRDYVLIQAPMAGGLSTADVVAGASRAGALGSLGSAAAYQHYGWLGVCLLGGGLGVLAVGYGVWITRFSPRPQTPPDSEMSAGSQVGGPPR